MSETPRDPLTPAARAARSLSAVFGRAARRETDLAGLAARTCRELGARLEALAAALGAESGEKGPLLAESAGLCGDLATLAACNASAAKDPADRAEILAAVRACERSLKALEELAAKDGSSGASFVARDLRVGGWKASLAADQLRSEAREAPES